MNVLLLGASGFVGGNLARALNAKGHGVRAVSRRHGSDLRALTDPAAWAKYLAGVDAVVNCAGIIAESRHQRFSLVHTAAPIALFDACLHKGVRRVVQISALGADGDAQSAFHLSKRAADQHLRGLDLDWLVLRPSLVYGRGGTSAELLMRLASLPLIPVPGDGKSPVQPVHVSDLVAAILRCLSGKPACRTVDAVGPDTMTIETWLRVLRASVVRSPAGVLHLPYGVAIALAGLLRSVIPVLQPDVLRMLRRGCIGDARAFARLLGRPPRKFDRCLPLIDAHVPCAEETV